MVDLEELLRVTGEVNGCENKAWLGVSGCHNRGVRIIMQKRGWK